MSKKIEVPACFAAGMKKQDDKPSTTRATMPLTKNEKLDVAAPRDVKDLARMFGGGAKTAAKEPIKKQNTTTTEKKPDTNPFKSGGFVPKPKEEKKVEEPKKAEPKKVEA